jgi:hypothetical protein
MYQNQAEGAHTAVVDRYGVASWVRRQQARRRMAPLACGCPDPWPCRCTEPPLSDRALDGWRDAALHVLRTGHMPLLPIEVRRALYRRGGRERQLAERLHRGCGGEAT